MQEERKKSSRSRIETGRREGKKKKSLGGTSGGLGCPDQHKWKPKRYTEDKKIR